MMDEVQLALDKEILNEFLDAYEAQEFVQAIGMEPQLLSISARYDLEDIQHRRCFIVYGLLAQAHSKLGNFKSEVEMAKNCLAASIRSKDADMIGRAYGSMGNAFYSVGNFKESIAMHEQSLALAEAAGDAVAQSSCFGNLGNAYSAIGQLTKAIEMQEKSLSVWLQIGDRARQGKAYGNLGNAYFAASQFIKAIEMHEKDLEIAIELQDIVAQRMAYANLGNAYCSLGQYDRAIQLQEQARDIADAIGDLAGQSRACIGLGNAYCFLSRFQRSIELCKEGLALAEQIGDVVAQSRAIGCLGNAHNGLGEFAAAIACFERELDIAERAGDRTGQLGALGNMGNAFKSTGQFGRAIDMYELCLKIAQEVGDAAAQGQAYGNLGILHRALGQTAKAIEMHGKDLAATLATHDVGGQAVAYVNLGNAYQSLGRHAKALALYERSLAIVRGQSDAAREGSVLGTMSTAYLALGQADRAVELLERTLAIASETGDRALQGVALGNLGRAKLRLGDAGRAAGLFEQELALAAQMGDPAAALDARNSLATLALSRGDPAAAVAHLEAALGACESLQEHLFGRDGDRITLFEMQGGCYARYQQALLALGRDGDALAAAERSKARALDGLLRRAQRRAQTLAAASPAAAEATTWEGVRRMVAEEGCALLEYSLVDAGRLAVWLVSPGGELLACRQVAVEEELVYGGTLSAQLELALCGLDVRGHGASGPPADALAPQPGSEGGAEGGVSAEALRAWVVRYEAAREEAAADAFLREVAPDEVLLEWAAAVMEQHRSVRAFLRAVAGAGASALGAGGAVAGGAEKAPAQWGAGEPEGAAGLLEAAEAVAARVVSWRDLRGLTDARLEAECGVRSPAVRAALLARLAEALDEGRLLRRLYALLIAPVAAELRGLADVLIVPTFDLFMVPWAALTDARGRALAEDHTLRLAPSLSTARLAARGAAAMAAAARGGDGLRAVVVGDPGPVLQRGFARLPHAADEAREVADVLGVRPLTGARATRGEVARRLAGAEWAHLACHGWLERQALVLAPGGPEGAAGAGPGDDGLLTVGDVQGGGGGGGGGGEGVRLAPGSTVVLSACDTAGGDVCGEGVVGLARAFLAAGAGAAVVSLWAVPDEGTRQLMSAFYAALARGDAAPQALRAAMLSVRQPPGGGPPQSALAWAGFVVVGARTALPGPGRPPADSGHPPPPAGSVDDPVGPAGMAPPPRHGQGDGVGSASVTGFAGWSVRAVADWLEREDLGALAGPFVDNEVDGPTLEAWAGHGEGRMGDVLRLDLGVGDPGLCRSFWAAFGRLAREAGGGPCGGTGPG